jgi:hypothetical protein
MNQDDKFAGLFERPLSPTSGSTDWKYAAVSADFDQPAD